MPVTKRVSTSGSKGLWWRFNRYEIRDGCIHPARGASLKSFDPWAECESRDGNIDFPPYLQLAELVREIPADRSPSPVPPEQWSPELQRNILKWCGRYGLLGLLPHTTLSARFGSWCVTRIGGEWSESTRPWSPGPFEPQWAEVIEDDFGEGVEVGDDHGWWYYFPDVSKVERGEGNASGPTLRLVPTSGEFWKWYAEPLEYFIRIACFFEHAIRVIGDPSGNPVVEHRGEELTRDKALARLTAYANCVSVGLTEDTKDGSFTQIWRSPSLLGHLSMQAIQNLLGERRIINCRCGATFSSAHWNAKHCTETCASRYKKRDQRERDKRLKR
jgi:hypothetical protein